ncbi:GNAT family N-acetyltransferase [bacterium]|nr:GNAT family N-acetyltransferase [bacterium]
MIIRPAQDFDAPALAELLNEIIHLGGTTAHETPFSTEAFLTHYVDGPEAFCCHLAEADRPLGFQVLGLHPDLPEGWLEIGTFVRPAARGKGAAKSLFRASKTLARSQGRQVINATIRADNAVGLGYYTSLGFTDYASEPGYRLKDGRQVGRISKRFDLRSL